MNSPQQASRMPIITINQNKGRLTDSLYKTIWENFEKERERKNPYYRTTRKPRKLSTTKRKNALMYSHEHNTHNGEGRIFTTPEQIFARDRAATQAALKIWKEQNSRSADGL